MRKNGLKHLQSRVRKVLKLNLHWRGGEMPGKRSLEREWTPPFVHLLNDSTFQMVDTILHIRVRVLSITIWTVLMLSF